MDLLPIQSLLQKGIFKTPNYQRGYAWGKVQLDDFKDDLILTHKNNEHYTGTITVIQTGNHPSYPNNFKTYDVVDGHQRLTTISIFIQCCFNRLEKLNLENEALAKIRRNLVLNDNPIVRIAEESMEFYSNYILTNKSSNKVNFSNKSEEKLFKAKEYFLNEIRLKTKREVLQYLECILNKFKVNLFKLSTESEVGLVFETMNNRGLPLTEIDKVKNYLIFLSNKLNNEGLAKIINEKFTIIFKNLRRVPDYLNKTDDDFLRYSLIVYVKSFQEIDLYNYVKTQLITKDHFSEKNITKFIDFLEASSEAYSNIQQNNYYDNLIFGNSLKNLKSTGNIGNFIPILISIIIKNPDQDNLLKVITLFEKFAFRIYSIIGYRSDKGQKLFHDLAYDSYKKLNFIKIKKDTKDLISEIEKIGNKENFRKALTNPIINPDTKFTKSLIYFFQEYEKYLIRQNAEEYLNLNNSKAKTYPDEFEIEYILTLNDKNNKKPNALNKLGNLFITQNKNALSNKSYSVKKNYFKKSKLLLEKELLEYQEWNEETIKERTQKLVNFAAERWKI